MELTRDNSAPTANDTAHTLKEIGGFVYCAGPTVLGGVPLSNSFGRIDPYTNQVKDIPLPGCNSILDFTVMNGIVYVCGSFSAPAPNPFCAAYDMDGNLQAWDPAPNAAVSSVVGDGTYVYASGVYTSIGGQSRNGLAQLDPTTGLDSGTAFPSPAGFTFEMYVYGGKLYIVGNWSLVDASTRQGFASIDIASATLDAWDPDVAPAATARGILFSGSSAYIMGIFTQVNGGAFTRNGIAKVDLAAGAVDAVFDADIDTPFVRSAIIDGENLYFGGVFSTVGGQTRPRAAIVDAVTGAVSDTTFPLGWGVATVADLVRGAGTKLLMGAFGDSDYYLAAFFLVEPPDPPTGTPQPPRIRFLNRRTRNGALTMTLLRWDPVTRDVYGNPITVDSYLVFRTSSKNLEDPALVASVSSLDLAGRVDTLFIEEIDGYFRYCVSARCGPYEGRKSCVNLVPTQQLERLG